MATIGFNCEGATTMPMVMVQEYRGCRVAVMCDRCGKEIVDGSKGNYHWRVPDCASADRETIYFTHDDCCYYFEESMITEGFFWCSDSLSKLPFGLQYNLKAFRKKPVGPLEWDGLIYSSASGIRGHF